MTTVATPRTVATTVTANTTATAGKHLPVDATAGAVTITLPAATTTNAGAHLSVEKRDSSTNLVTISGSIRGTVTTVALTWKNETIEFIGDASGSWVPTAGHKTKTSLDLAYSRTRSRVVWSLGDSTAAGSPAGSAADSEVAASVPAAKSSITFQTTSWQPWGLFASQGKWTLGGIVATGGYTAAQIRDTLMPQLLAVAQPGDTVVVQAGTNGQVIADVRNIYDALRAAGLYTVAVSIAPSTSSTVTNVEAFNALLKDYCNTNGIPLVDAYGLFVDPTSAAYRSTYLADGVHPNAAGFQALGQLIAATLNTIFPTDPGLLVRHNAGYTPQKITKPLSGGVNGTDWGLFVGLGTSTVTTASDTDFQGGQCYLLTKHDTNIQMDFAPSHPTLTAGKRYRVGFAVKTSLAAGGTWQVLIESNTTGTRHLWGFGYPSYLSANQGSIGRVYSEFVAAVTDTYRFRVSIGGTAVDGDTLKIGELTLLDLTAEGL